MASDQEPFAVMDASSCSPQGSKVPFKTHENMFKSIPDEISRQILSFCAIPDLVRFAATSSHYRRFVLKDCALLWKEIDFEKVPQAKHMTDECLAALLTNIHARNVTTKLSIFGCTNVRGLGLEPLRGSKRLEEIELRKSKEEIDTVGETGLDDDFVVSVLSSMSPISKENRDPTTGLKGIKIRKQYDAINYYEQFEWNIRRLQLLLNDAILEQVREHRTACTHCKEVAIDKVPTEDASWQLPLSFCSQCKNFTCGEDTCPFVLDCKECMNRYCQKCDIVTSCDECNDSKYYCTNCMSIVPCNTCERSYCEYCRFVAFCYDCEMSYCEDCGGTSFCSICDKCFCDQCGGVSYCHGCEELFCSECDPFATCSSCDNVMPFCKDCRVKKRNCDFVSCDQCLDVSFCDGCEDLFCSNCDPLVYCSRCYDSFCGKCCKVRFEGESGDDPVCEGCKNNESTVEKKRAMESEADVAVDESKRPRIA